MSAGGGPESSESSESGSQSPVVLEIKRQLDANIMERFKQSKEQRLQEFKHKQQMDELKRAIERKDSIIIDMKKSLERVRNIEFTLRQTENSALSLREDNTKLKLQFQELERKYRGLNAELKIERNQRQALEASRNDVCLVPPHVLQQHGASESDETLAAVQQAYELRDQIKALEKENEALSSQLAESKEYYDQEIEKLQDALGELEAGRDRVVQTLENEVDMYKTQLDDLLVDKDQLERSLNDSQVERSEAIEKYVEFERIREREKRSSTIYQKQAEKQIEERETTIADLNFKLDDCKRKLKDQSDKFIAVQKKYFMLQYQTDQRVATESKKANEKLKQFQEQRVRLAQELKQAQKDRSIALNQVKWYKEENTAITRQCKENKIKYQDHMAELREIIAELKAQMADEEKAHEQEINMLKRDSTDSVPPLPRFESNVSNTFQMAVVEEDKSDNEAASPRQAPLESLGEQIEGLSGFEPPRLEKGSSVAQSPMRRSTGKLGEEVGFRNGGGASVLELNKEIKDLKVQCEAQRRDFMKEISSLQRNLRSAYVELQSMRRKSLLTANPDIYLSPLDSGGAEKLVKQLQEERDALVADMVESKGRWAEENNFLTEELRRAERIAVEAKMQCAQIALEKDSVVLKLRKFRQKK